MFSVRCETPTMLFSVYFTMQQWEHFVHTQTLSATGGSANTFLSIIGVVTSNQSAAADIISLSLAEIQCPCARMLEPKGSDMRRTLLL